MRKKLFAILSLTGLFLFISTADISAQYNFDDVVDQAVLGWGETGQWDEGLVWFPTVIKDGDIYKMWYTGADDWQFSGPISKIGYAWSSDGITWNRYSGNPVLQADLDWEGAYLIGSVVIKDGSTFKMWYGTTYNATNPVGYATSADGITWTKHPTPVLEIGPESEWDSGNMQPTTVIKEGDTYKMWYWAGMPGFPYAMSFPQTGFATSPDGINWTKYDNPNTTEPPYAYSDPVLKVGADDDWDSHRASTPMVLKKGSGYEMWYTGLKAPLNTETKQHLGYAQSEDGINWVKYPEPVFTDPRVWGRDINGGSVLSFDGYYHLWYALFHFPDAMAQPQIGYAIAFPMQMLDDLIAKVEVLEDDGFLNKGQANALIKKLESAKESIKKGNYNAAVNKLNAFINHVNAFINGGILTDEQGNELIADAQAIIDILENFPGFKIGEAGPDGNNEIAGVFDLEQNYPNPFKSTTTISFSLAESDVTTLKVYNSMGQEVATLFNVVALANERYQIEFNSNDLVEGIYFCVLKIKSGMQTMKMIKMK